MDNGLRIVFIGAGRLASSLAPALHKAGCCIVQVFSRTLESAQVLASKVGAEAVDDMRLLTADAEVYIFAVTDTALPSLISQVTEGRGEALFLHTAGSVAMDVFKPYAAHYGALYPMQTFSKEREVDFSQVTFFIEASDDSSLLRTRMLAEGLSRNVIQLSSEGRKNIHMAAVFACNFANHCYQLSAEILERYGVPFSVMQSLVDETAQKVHHLAPADAQSGPALRHDESVMSDHLSLLASMPYHERVYRLMSESIQHSDAVSRQRKADSSL